MIQIGPFLKDAEICFAELNSGRIIRATYYIQACNFKVVPPYAIINPKKAWYGIFKDPVSHFQNPSPSLNQSPYPILDPSNVNRRDDTDTHTHTFIHTLPPPGASHTSASHTHHIQPDSLPWRGFVLKISIFSMLRRDSTVDGGRDRRTYTSPPNRESICVSWQQWVIIRNTPIWPIKCFRIS